MGLWRNFLRAILALVVPCTAAFAQSFDISRTSVSPLPSGRTSVVLPNEYIVRVEPATVEALVHETSTQSLRTTSSTVTAFQAKQAAGHTLVQNALGSGVAVAGTRSQPSASITDFIATPELFLIRNISDGQAANLISQPGIARITPNRRVIALNTPSDLNRNQWGLDHPTPFTYPARDGTRQTSLPQFDINAPEAWDTTTGSEDVGVAIIDSGVDTSHPDLVDNLFTNSREIPNNNRDDDQNGVVDDYAGYDFSSRVPSTTDTVGHGTFIAGIVAARQNNTGIVGTTWRTRYLPLKVADRAGNIDMAALVDALHYVASLRERGENIRVLNLSYGYQGSAEELEREALSRVINAGVFVAVAAGNDATDNDVINTYPANYRFPGLITVASADPNGTLSSFSNFGRTSVGIAAPGGLIYSTVPASVHSSRFKFMDGTSFAAPYVAGVAALMFARNPAITPLQVATRLKQTARAVQFSRPLEVSGLLDARAAVAAAALREVTVIARRNPGGTPVSGLSVTVGQGSPARAQASTGQDGRASVLLNPGEQQTFFFAKQGFTVTPASLPVTATSDLEIQVSLSPNPVTISGQVFDGLQSPSNSGLPGITVNLSAEVDGSTITRAATTDSQGRYTFSDPALVFGARYTVGVSNPNLTATGPFSGTAAGNVIQNFTATPAIRTLTGSIAINNFPISGVTVRASRNGSVQSVTSDSSGRFRLLFPHGSQVGLSYQKSGFTFSSAPTSFTFTSDSTLSITPEPGPVTISGIVRHGTSPVPGATITLVGGAYGSTVNRVATSNAQGQYSLTGSDLVVGTTYTVSMRAENFTANGPFSGTAAENVIQDFSATLVNRALQGTVAINNVPIPGVTIRATRAGTTQTATSNSAGQFSFAFPHGSSVALSYQKAGFAFTSAPASVVLNGNQTLSIVPSANPVTFSGIVRNGTTPLPNVTVTITGGSYGTQVNQTTTTNAQGRYTLSGASLVVGMSYTVAASAPNRGLVFSAAGTGTATANVTKDFTATPTVLSGRVLFNGAGLAQVRVTIGGISPAPAAVVTNAQGFYTVTGVIPPGFTVTINPVRAGYRIPVVTRTMPPSGSLPNVNFTATR